MAPAISVCMVTGRRTPLLDACLASLRAQVDPPPFELLVCSDGDPEVADAVHRQFPGAGVVEIERAHPGAARNVLLDHVRGDLLLFLDDDVTVEPHMLRRLAQLALHHPEAAVFGGPNDTPPGSTAFQLVQGAVLASFVGAGPVRRRYGPHPAGPADERYFILCNLAVRRSVMRPFDRSLLCAEENELLSALSDEGVRMHYDPELVVYHERRGDLRGFLGQMHKYGRGRGEVARRRPSTLRPWFLAPSAMLAYLVAAPALTAAAGWVALVPVGAYLAAAGANAVAIAVTLRRPVAVPSGVALIAMLHAAYGTGVVRGLLRPSRERSAPVVTTERPGQGLAHGASEDAAPAVPRPQPTVEAISRLGV